MTPETQAAIDWLRREEHDLTKYGWTPTNSDWERKLRHVRTAIAALEELPRVQRELRNTCVDYEAHEDLKGINDRNLRRLENAEQERDALRRQLAEERARVERMRARAAGYRDHIDGDCPEDGHVAAVEALDDIAAGCPTDSGEQPIDSRTCPECRKTGLDVSGRMPYWSVCPHCKALGPAAGSPLASHFHWCEYLGLQSRDGRPSIGQPMTKQDWMEARKEEGVPVPGEGEEGGRVMQVWVLTYDVNEYDQHGQYFVTVFFSEPTVEQIHEALIKAAGFDERYVSKGNWSLDDMRADSGCAPYPVKNGGESTFYLTNYEG